jgi:hypothetical protein
MTYNGWTNYETWLCNIHFDNWDFSEYVSQIADTEPEDEGDVRNWLEDFIRESVRDVTQDQVDAWDNPWAADLMMAAFSEIDFRDIAEHYSEELWEEVGYYMAQQASEEDEGKPKEDIPPFADLEKEFGLKPEKSGYQAIIDQGSY